MAEKPGLRERKKQQTRLAISQVATRMFIERGFDQVTVAEVAQAAQVSVNTVFNYFVTKEELFFDRAEEVEEAPSRIVRERQPGESAIDALYLSFRQALKHKVEPSQMEGIKRFGATVDASPALKARARLMLEQSKQRLMQTLIEETGAEPDDPAPQVVAAMVIALELTMIQEVQTRLLRGESVAQIRSALLRLGERAFEMLRPGVGDYCVRTT